MTLGYSEIFSKHNIDYIQLHKCYDLYIENRLDHHGGIGYHNYPQVLLIIFNVTVMLQSAIALGEFYGMQLETTYVAHIVMVY